MQITVFDPITLHTTSHQTDASVQVWQLQEDVMLRVNLPDGSRVVRLSAHEASRLARTLGAAGYV